MKRYYYKLIGLYVEPTWSQLQPIPAVFHSSPEKPFGPPVENCLDVKSVDDALKLIYALEKRDIYNKYAGA